MARTSLSTAIADSNNFYFYFHSLRSHRNPPVASADTLLLNPPTIMSQKASSSFGGSDALAPQKKHGSLDNLRLQGTVTGRKSQKTFFPENYTANRRVSCPNVFLCSFERLLCRLFESGEEGTVLVPTPLPK